MSVHIAQTETLVTLVRAAHIGERRVSGRVPGASPLGRELVAAWRDECFRGNAELWAQRLSAEHLTEELLAGLVSVATTEDEPPWWQRLTALYGAARGPWPVCDAPRGPSRFLTAVAPLLDHALDELTRTLRESDVPPRWLDWTDQQCQALLTDLSETLLALLGPAFTLELNVARVTGRFTAPTPEDRFDEFIDSLTGAPAVLAILGQYPVLARELVERTTQWVAGTAEMVSRIAADWSLLCGHFEVPEHDAPMLQPGLGDPHRYGRRVAGLHLRNGRSIIYKPRSVAPEAHFQELLGWLNQHGQRPEFATLAVLERDGYGYMARAEPATCTERAELVRFYWRMGGLVAVAYLCGATDLHSENLIASGEHPMLIDLETLFTPEPPRSDSETGKPFSTWPDCVLRSGLLPNLSWMTPGSEGVELSGIGGRPGQLTPFSIPDYEAVGTDEMRLTPQRIEMPTADNRPTLCGEEVDPLEFADDLLAGFDRTYQLLVWLRAQLVRHSPCRAFRSDPIRVVLRTTATYGLLQVLSHHPTRLGDAVERDMLFDRLWQDVSTFPALAGLVGREQESLRRGDVPVFATSVDGRALCWDGEVINPQFFPVSGWDDFVTRVNRLGPHDRERQAWLAEASMALLSLHGSEELPYPTRQVDPPSKIKSNEAFLAEARRIARRLDALRFGSGAAPWWVGVTSVQGTKWSLAPASVPLSDGLPGIILYLAYLGDRSGDRSLTSLARGAYRVLRRMLDQTRAMPIGLFTGTAGLVYLASHLAALWADEQYLDFARAQLDRLRANLPEDRQYDVVNGSAGVILALRSLYAVDRDSALVDLIVEAGEQLVRSAVPKAHGVGWPVVDILPEPMAGMAHGAGGIALALATAGALSKVDKFRRYAELALEYEDSLFVAEHDNWLDLRSVTPEAPRHAPEHFMTAWCYGSPGIGIARLAMKALDGSGAHDERVRSALRNVVGCGFGSNQSLCHGDAGNLELLMLAGTCGFAADAVTQARELASAMVERVHAERFRSGQPLGVETPGLLNGLAGYGYQLLRMYDPTVPSVLAIEPPR